MTYLSKGKEKTEKKQIWAELKFIQFSEKENFSLINFVVISLKFKTKTFACF